VGLMFYVSGEIYFIEWDILTINSSRVILTFLFDWISLTFMGYVSLISSLVLLYRTYYIEGDRYFFRFISLVYLFVLSIFFLILSPNIIRILLGWDGLGLVSYCLVIYYQNNKSANAGIITILSNRIGDVAILLSISWLLNFGSWNFFYLQFIYSYDSIKFIIFFVIIAAITKRAQMPFSAWLPAAIAAPTPVSALVHSSTLVTAGVYLLIRFNYLLGLNNFLFYVGVLTMFISGLGANFENDLKKIIALSTLSQLGLMIITLSMGFYELSFFHLLAHALFKSLLFLCAGVFIHSIGDIQDIRHLGGLIFSCPITSFYFIGSSLALCGFPFLTGFYSKDLILEVYFILRINSFIYILIFFSTIFTITYSVRLVYFLFFKNMGVKSFINLEERLSIVNPMRFLFIASIIAGRIISWFYFPCFSILLPFYMKISILIGLTVFSVIIFFFNRRKSVKFIYQSKKLVYFLGSIWFLPFISTVLFMPILKIGEAIVKFFDQGWLEHLGGQNLIYSLRYYSSKIDYFLYLNIKSYLIRFFFICFFVFILFYLNSLNRAWLWSCQGSSYF